MAASYPSSAKSFTPIVDGTDYPQAADVNEAYDEITAIEQALVTSGLAHDLLFVDATHDIGNSGAFRPRDLFLSRNETIGGTLDVAGVATFAAVPVFSTGLGAVSSSSSILSSSPSAGIGYATGAGATVTQLTNKQTGVTLNTITGQITTANSSMNAGDDVVFTVTNSAVAATDAVIVNHASGGTAGAYIVSIAAVAAGSFKVMVSNASAGPLSEALVINFAVIKGVAA